MQSGPKYKAVSVDLNNASPEQQNLFKSIEQFFDPNISVLMQMLGNKVFMNKNLKINIKFQSDLGRATLEKDPTQPFYQLTLSSNARSIDALFDFIHALYDINSNTFGQTLTDVKFLDHRFYNAFKKTFEAMYQMFSSSIDYASLGIDKADLEHLRNAMPGQSHEAIQVKNSQAKDFTLKSMEQEFKEYSAVSKDESGSKKISIFTKKPEYSIKSLPKPAKLAPAELKAQAQAAKSQVFVDRESNTICCSICAQSGIYSIVIKNDQGYYCDRGGYIAESAVLEAKKFIGENATVANAEVAVVKASSKGLDVSVAAVFTASVAASTTASTVVTTPPASPKSAAAAITVAPKSTDAATTAVAAPAAVAAPKSTVAATLAVAAPAAVVAPKSTVVTTTAVTAPSTSSAVAATIAVATTSTVAATAVIAAMSGIAATTAVAGPAFNAEVFAYIERIKDSSQKTLASQRAQDLPKRLMANLLELLNASPEKAAKFLAQKNELWVNQVINAKSSSQQLFLNNLPQKIALNEENSRQAPGL